MKPSNIYSRALSLRIASVGPPHAPEGWHALAVPVELYIQQISKVIFVRAFAQD